MLSSLRLRRRRGLPMACHRDGRSSGERSSNGRSQMSTPVGPYTPVVKAGPFVVTSGQVGLKTGDSGPALVEGGLVAQTRQAIANVATVLSEFDLAWTDVFKTTVYLTDIAAY